VQLDIKFPPTVSAFMQSDARHRFILGPFGSGKTVGSITELLRRASNQRPSTLNGMRKSRWAVVRQTTPQLRDTTIKSFLDWYPTGTLGYYQTTTKTYYVKQGDIDSEIIFRALDDAADVRNLLGLELTGANIAEFRETASDIVEGLDGRIGRYPRMNEGGPTWVGIWGDSNFPEIDSYWWAMAEGKDPKNTLIDKPNSWEFFVQPPGMLRVQHGDGTYHYVSNPNAENLENLPKGYYENLVVDKTDDYIRTYVMCEYGRSKGGLPVHPMFSRDMHVSKTPLRPNKDLLLLVSADFGLTPAMVLKQQDAFGRVLTLDEITTFGMGLERAIDTKLLPLLRAKYDGFEIFVTGDPSGNTGSQGDETSCADVFRRYKRKGLGKVKFAYSNNPVHRQGATDHFLSKLVDRGMPAYQIDPSCLFLIQALEGKYQFKKSKDGRHISDVDKNDWSHVAEANHYGDMYFEKGGRRKAEHRDEMDYLTALQMQRSNVNHYSMPR
jgi:hypothetical protein